MTDGDGVASSKAEAGVHTCMTGTELLADLHAHCLATDPAYYGAVMRLLEAAKACGDMEVDVSDAEDWV